MKRSMRRAPALDILLRRPLQASCDVRGIEPGFPRNDFDLAATATLPSVQLHGCLVRKTCQLRDQKYNSDICKAIDVITFIPRGHYWRPKALDPKPRPQTFFALAKREAKP